MKFTTLLFILISLNVFGSEHNFSIRDSQSGALINAEVMIQQIDRNDISASSWQEIKRGNPISDTHTEPRYKLYQEKGKYNLESNQYMQIISVKANGYKTLNTYIEAYSEIGLSTIMLDKEPSNKKNDSDCIGANICGYVYDNNSLKPLKNVLLNLSNNQMRFSSYSYDSGLFVFKQDIPVDAVLTTTHKGYKSNIWYQIAPESKLNIIIDLQKGKGVIEKSLRHSLKDVINNQVDEKWLNAKLSQKASESNLATRERSSGAVYLEPPASIRVGFDGSGGTCCGSNCSTSQVYSLETYVQRGLDNEWIASWQSDSLKAGSIPYRSYGAWHVLNEVYTGYDICAGPCCQAFGYTGYADTIAAAVATNGIMLDKNGDIARSEYSAQNNSWDDPNDGLTCNNADLSCGDGNVGSPATGWTCLTDTVSTGQGCFGHGRGMSQWGTQYHAQNNDSFADVVDHYYNASNNPSGQRSQYASTPIRLDAITASTYTVSENELFSIDYEIFSSANDTELFGPLLLGASLVNNTNSYSDSINDFAFNISVSGVNNIQRIFQVPENTVPGVYDLVTSVYLDVNSDNDIAAADWKLTIQTLPAAMTVLNANDLIFKDSF